MVIRVEICGGIAAGKTTLAGLLAEAGRSAVYEKFRAVPFWQDFYRSPEKFAFQTEVGFLLQHFHQMQLSLEEGQSFVCDYSLIQDKSYAEVNLDEDARTAFFAVYQYILGRLPAPTLLIHLECGEQEQLRRIRRRGRSEEASINVRYLAALNRAISRNTVELGRHTKLLTIDSEKCDFAGDDVDRQLVQDRFCEAAQSLTEP